MTPDELTPRTTKVRKYAYWSERRISAFSGDNDLGIYKRAWKFSIGIPKLLTFEVNDDRRTKSRDQIAKSTLDFLGSSAVEDFAKSSRVEIAKGRGSVEFANYSGGHNGVVTYTEVRTSAGERVGVCLFGSLDNMADWAGAQDDFAAGWSSSAWYAIGDLLRSRGVVKRSQWDDDEQLSVEVLKVATEQGKTAASVPGEPWTRGYTLSRADDAEWVAEIFMDTRLTPGRWADLPANVDRILTGALMWVRTGPQSITRYSKLRRNWVDAVLNPCSELKAHTCELRSDANRTRDDAGEPRPADQWSSRTTAPVHPDAPQAPAEAAEAHATPRSRPLVREARPGNWSLPSPKRRPATTCTPKWPAL